MFENDVYMLITSAAVCNALAIVFFLLAGIVKKHFIAYRVFKVLELTALATGLSVIVALVVIRLYTGKGLLIHDFGLGFSFLMLLILVADSNHRLKSLNKLGERA